MHMLEWEATGNINHLGDTMTEKNYVGVSVVTIATLPHRKLKIIFAPIQASGKTLGLKLMK